MSSDRETTRIVRSWLEEGVTELPDRVLDAVMDQLPATPQRRVTWWPAWGLASTRSAMATAIAAAAVVAAIALIGLGIAIGGRVGGPDTDEATPTPATELPTDSVPIEPGRYTLASGFPAIVTFDVPDGWNACVYSTLEQGVCGGSAASGVSFLAVENVVVHPCGTRLREPPAGHSVDAFVSALSDLTGFSVTEPVDITRSGLAGQRVTVTAPVDPQCQELRTWSVPGRTNGVHAGEVNVVEVFDVGGRLVAIIGSYDLGMLSSEQLAAVRSIMDSVEIRP